MGTFNMDKPVLNVQWANILKLPGKVMANVDVNYQSKGHYQNMYFTRNVFGFGRGLNQVFLKGKHSFENRRQSPSSFTKSRARSCIVIKCNCCRRILSILAW